MAGDITVTAANVLAGSGATLKTVVAGATVSAGVSLYKDPADDKYKLAYAGSDSTADQRACDGIALGGASDGQPLVIVEPSGGGNIDLGATLDVGHAYVVSPAGEGGIAPISDLATGDFPIIIGIATAADNLRMKLIDPDVQKA